MLFSGGNHTIRRAVASALLVVGMLPVALDGGLSGSQVDAQLFDPFVPPAFSVNQAGAIDIIGNGLLTCGATANCQATLAGTRNSGNGSFNMVALDADDGVLPAAAANQTTRSSSANFTPPAGSNVLYAALYWSGQSNSAIRNQMKLLAPGDNTYTTVTGTIDNSGNLYQGRADVTALVQAAGPGDYWGADVQANVGRNTYAAWSMVIVYGNPALPVRNLSVFEGFGRVSSGFRRLDVPVTGFLTPPFGNVNAEIGVVAYEGDRNIGGDQVLIDVDPSAATNFQNLTDAANPTTNFGNGSISNGGVTQTGSTPNSVNNLNVDIDEFATVNTLQNAQTDTTVSFRTTGDWWYPGALTFQVDLFVPEFPQVTKTVVDRNGGDALPGDILDYSVTFTNTGNDGAEDSIVRDAIPDDTTFVPGSISVTNGNGSLVGNEIVAPVGDGPTTPPGGGTILPGETAVVEFSVTVDPSARGTDIENSATLDYVAQTLQDPFTFTTNETVTPVPPLADLRVSKSGSPDPVAPGNSATWTIVVTNDGPNTATGVTLTDTLPSNVGTATVTGATCSGTSTLTCSLPDLALNASQTITIVTPVDQDLPVGKQIVNSVNVSGNEDDDQLGNNSAVASLSARPESDLSVVKTDVIDPVPAGGTVTYNVTVTNNGPSNTQNVNVVDTPVGGEFQITALSMPGASCTVASGSCLLPALASGDSATMNVTATVLGSAGPSITNRAEVSSSNLDLTPANNTIEEDTGVTPNADVGVVKTTPSATAGNVVAGEIVTYQIVANNTGASPAANTHVTDTLDSRLTLVSAVSTIGSCDTSGAPLIDCDLGTLNLNASATITITAVLDADATPGTGNLSNTAAITTDTIEIGTNPNTSTVINNISNEPDLRITKAVDSNPLEVGDTFEYTIVVTNDGPSDSAGPITMTDPMPAGLDAVSTTETAGTCGISGTAPETVTCTSAASLAVGDSITYTISGNVVGAANPTADNIATVSNPNDPNTSNNQAETDTDLVTNADVHIDKEWQTPNAANPTVIAGNNATFTLVVVNDGPTDGAQVNVIDLVPSGTIVSATPTTGSCSGVGGSSLACDLGIMDNGDSITITVEVAIDPDASAGVLNNSASAIVTGVDDRNPSNNSDTDGITVTRSADIGIAKIASDDTPVAGSTITYTVDLTNAGPSSAEASFVGDSLPPGLTFVPNSFIVTGAPNAAATPCTESGGALTCDLGTLAPGATPQITYDVVVAPTIDPGATLTNTATASSPTPDPTPPTIDEVITVETSADLSTTKTASLPAGTAGGPLDYTIRISNAGPSEARNVELADALPTGYTATAATSTQGNCDTTVSCTNIGTIAPGGFVDVNITGGVDANFAGTSITNDATATASTPDPNDPTNGIDNNTGSSTVPIAARADLGITKAASPATIDAGGGQITYSIAVTNVGPSDATSVSVADTLPTGFVVDSITPSQGTCSAFPCDLGTITAGQAPATISVVGHFPSTVAAATLTNSATVSSAVTDPNDATNGTDNNTATADVVVTNAADVTVAKSGPVFVVAGDSRQEDPNNAGSFAGGASYTIAVGNDGPSTAQGVVLTDVLDPAIVDVSNVVLSVVPTGACTPTITGGAISCSIGDLGVGELVSLNIVADIRPDAPAGSDNLVNDAEVDATTTDPTPGNNNSVVLTDVTLNADLGIVKTKATNSAFGATATQFVAGETLTYDLVVTNNGSSDATDVVVTDTPPGPVALGAVTSIPAGCTSLPCTIPSLAAGDSVTVTVEATVDENTNSTSVTNVADVTATTPDGNSANNTSSVTNGVVRRADVELTSKDSSPTPVVAGQVITYTIVGTNLGPSTARDAELTDTVPANTTLVSSSLPANCSTTGTAAGSTITCDLSDLVANDSATVTFDVTVDGDATGTISNTASIASATTQPTIGVNNADPTVDDEATEPTTIIGDADVSIVKSAAPTTAVPGETLTYTLTVDNAGPSTARDVVVTDDVSGIFDGAVTIGGTASATCTQAIVCDPFDLPVGSVTITISGTAAEANTAAIPNTAEVDSPTDSTPGNNTSAISTPVAPVADLVITKDDDVTTTVDPTGTITYTVTVTNNGPSTATDVAITDTLPTEIEATSISADVTATCTPASSGTPATGTVECTDITLADGASAVMTIVGTVSNRAVGTITNSATTTSTTPLPGAPPVATVDSDITPVADLGITKVLDTAPLIAGQPARYTIVVSNNGPATAEAVELAETLPAGVTFTAISSPVGTCDAAPTAGVVNCELGDLNDQATVSIEVEVLVDAATTANLVNSAAVSTTTQDPPTGNPNVVSTDSPVSISPDLRVQKALIPGDPSEPDLVAGDAFEYLITITNDGPSVASDVFTLTDQLPSQIVSAAAQVSIDNTNCSYAETGGAQPRLVTCSFSDDLAVGSSVTVTVTGTIDAGAATVDDNTATVATTDSPTYSDPTPGNNSGTAVATLVTNADLVASKTFDDSSVIAGASTDFTMSVVNNGPSTAAAVQLVDVLPVGMSFGPLPAGCVVDVLAGQERITCTQGSLAPGATFSVDVTIEVAPSYSAGPFSNTATASSSTPDRNPSNNDGVDDIDVVREADISVAKVADASSVLAGNAVAYTISYRNDGPSTAESAMIGDVLPAGVAIEGALPAGCAEASGILTCNLGVLAPMAPTDPDLTLSYTVRVDPAVADATDLENSATISSITPPDATPPTPSVATVTVGTSADVQLVSKTVTPKPVVAGTDVEYTITVTNNGPSIARATTITDDLPASLTAITPLPAGCSVTGQEVSCDLGTLTVGQTESIVFSATVAAATDPTTSITNDASVASAEPDPTPGNNDGSDTTDVDAEADITITKTAAPSPAVPGQPIEYTIVVANAGPSDATSVVVDDAAPVELTNVTAAADDGSTCSTAVSCNLGTLTAGETVTITVNADVLNTVTADITNTASVTSPTPPTAANPPRTVTIDTPVAPVADLAITKALAPVPPVPGAPVQYTIVVTNPGPSAAQNVVVSDTLDAAVTNLASATAGCVVAAPDVTCTFATLAPGTQTIVVTGDLDAGFTGDLDNTATVTTDTPEGANTSPNSASVSEPAAPDADVSIVKTASPDPVVAGQPLSYTLVVTNNGPSTAIDVSVADDVPAGFDLNDVTSTPTGCLSVDSGSPCVIPTLAVGATETITINGSVDADVTDLPANTATVTATTTDSTPGNNTSSADPVVGTSANLTTTKVLTAPASGPAVPGEAVEWVITVANNGPSDALNVEVHDTIPFEVTNVTIVSDPVGCTAFPCNFGTLATSDSVTVTITGDLRANVAAGDLVNAASTTSDTPDPVPTDNNPVATNPIVPSADVAIVKTGPTGDITPGTTAGYVLSITNAGPSDATDLVITDDLPAALDPSTVSVLSPSAVCSVTGLTVSCTQARLTVPSSISVLIVGTVLPGFTGALIDNTATVTAATPDPQGPNNTSTVSNNAAPEADLAIDKQLTSAAPPVPGQPVEYTIVVTNPGPSDSVNVRVADTVDAAIAGLSITSPAAGCAFTAQQLDCTYASISAGATETIVFTGTLSTAFTGSLDNTASLLTDTPQGSDASPNSSTSSEPTAPSADLTIAKVSQIDPVSPSGTITYDITVSNAGPSDATSVLITDTPANAADFSATSIVSDNPLSVCVLATLTCSSPSVAAGGSEIVTITATVSDRAVDTITNTANVTSATPDPTPNDREVDNTTNVVPLADLAVAKSLVLPAAPDVLTAGAPARYEIVVTNNGPATAVAAQIVDTLPTGVTFVSATPPVGSCDAAPAGSLTCELGDLADQASVTIVVNVDVAANQTADLANSVAVDSPTIDDPVGGNDTATTNSPVTVEADLQVTKVLRQPLVTAGAAFDYDIVITNLGTSTSVEDITLTDQLPAEINLATVTLSDTVNCSLTGDTVNCTFASELVSNDTITLTISGNTNSGAASLADNTVVVDTIDVPLVTQVDPNDSVNGTNNNTATASANLDTDADLVVAKSFDDPAVIAGNTTTFTMSVTNNGPSDAANVVLADTLPSGMTVVSVTPTGGACTAAAGATSISCDPLTLLPTETLSVAVTVQIDANAPAGTLSNQAEATSSTPDRNPSDNTFTDSIDVTRTADLTIAKLSDVGAQTAGDDVDFTVTVENNGPSTAEASVLGDALPAGMTIVPASISVTNAPNFVGPCTTPGGILTCDLGLLPPTGASPVVITYTVTIDADVATGATLTNVAQISSSTPPLDPTAPPPKAEVDVDVVTAADLEVVSKTVLPTAPVAGETAVYTVVARNNGPSTSLAARLVDSLPAGVTVDASSLLAGCTLGGAGDTITCDLGDLPPTPDPAATVTITYTVTVDADQTIGTELDNDVAISSAAPTPTPDPTPGNDDGTAKITVDTSADLTITKVAAAATFVPGEQVEWLITVDNAGPSDAAAVSIVDSVPAVVANVALTPSQGTCTAFPCDLGVIRAGGSATITVTGDLPADTSPGSLDNTATIDTPTDDPTPGGETATSMTPIVPSADVQIVKTVAPATLVPGEPVTYTLTATNNGPSDAQGIAIADTLPAELDLATVVVNAGTAACDPLAGRDLTCSQATLADGGVITITVTADVLPTVTTSVDNSVQLTTTTDDPTPPNDNSAITTPVAPVADIGLSKVISTAIVPGSTVGFEITVTNNGPSTAEDVVVTDTLPSYFTSVAVGTPGCAVVGNTVTCTFASVDPGFETINVTGVLDSDRLTAISNTADLTTTTTQTGSLPDTATVAGTPNAEADLAVEKTVTPTTVVAGDDVTYLITVDNLGPSDSLGVIVDDTLPAGLTLVSVTPSQGSCAALPCDLGDIEALSSQTVTVVATVDPSLTTLGANVATANSPGTPDGTPGNNTDSATPTVTTRADLATTKLLTPASAVPGESIRWTIEVTNPGPSDALNVMVADTITSDVENVMISSTQGGCSAFPCDLRTIPAGGSARIFIDADVKSNVLANTIENTATTTSDTPDGTPLDNTAVASNPLVPSANLAVVKAGPTGDVVAGSSVSYTITTTNNGPSDAVNVVIDDTLPAAFDASTITEISADADCTITGANINCTQAMLASGSSTVVTVTATVLSDFVGAEVVNTATATSDTVDPDPSDNTSEERNDNVPEADLSVTKATTVPAAGDPVEPGAPITYEITLANAGPSDAVNVVVTDVLPADVAITPVTGISTAATGASCDQTAVTCAFPAVAAGGTVTVIVTGTVSTRALDEIVNTVSVTSDTIDSTPGNDSFDLTTPVTAFADVGIAKSITSGAVVAGTQSRYELAVTNAGPAIATTTVVTDTLPAGVAFVSASTPLGSCTHDGATTGGLVTCAVGDLPDAAAFSILVDVDVLDDTTGSLTNTATIATPVDEPVVNNPNSATDVSPVTVSADLAIVKSLVQPELIAGAPFTYELVVTNNGPSDTSAPVTVNDDLPSIVNAATLSTAPGTPPCTITGTNVNCVFAPSIPVGDSVTVTINGSVQALATVTSVANTATVSSADDPDGVTGNNTSTSTNQAATDADLVLVKTFTNAGGTVEAGEDATFTLAVTNNGPSAAADSTISDVLPAGFTFDSASGAGANCAGSTSTTVNCTTGLIAVGATVTVNVVAAVSPDASAGPVTNTADVSSTTPDRNPTNTASNNIDVTRRAVLSIAKTVTSPTGDVLAGERISYQIVVGNTGPSSAEGTVLGDALPPSVTLDAGTISPGAPTCTAPGGVLLCDLGVLQPGDNRTIIYEVVVAADTAATSVTNVAQVSSPTPFNGPQSSTTTTGINTEADLQLTKTATPASVNAGETIDYTLVVLNNGPSQAATPTVTDDIPAGLTVTASTLPTNCALDLAGDVSCDLVDLDPGTPVSIVFSATVSPDQLTNVTNTASVSSTTAEPAGGGQPNSDTASTTITTQADLSIAKAATPATAVPGESLTYTITVTNPGPSTARSVSIADLVAPTLLDNATGTWAYGTTNGTCDNTINCAIGDLPVGNVIVTIVGDVPSDRTTALENAATVNTATPEGGNTSPNTATASTPVAPSADLRLDKVGPTSDVTAGSRVEWTLTVTNNGPSDALDVTLVDDLPTALDVATIVITDGGATCTLTGFELSCALASLADQATLVITVAGTLRSDFTDPEIENIATVRSSTTPDPDPTNNEGSSTNNNAPVADIAVTGFATPDPVAAGNDVTFDFTVTNNGPSDAADSVVTIPVPSGITVNGTPTLVGAPAGATVTVSPTGEIVVDLGTLPPNTPVMISFVGTVAPTVAPGPIVIPATSTTSTSQATTDNDNADVTVNVINAVDLSVVKTASSDTVDFDGTVTFTIVVTNAGVSAARDAVVTDDVPSNFQVTSAATSAGTCTTAGNLVTCTGVDVDPNGGSATITIEALAVESGTAVNVASVDCPCLDDPIVSSGADVEVVRRSDLGISKVASTEMPQVGTNITYTIQPTNAGPHPAVDAVVTEQLPAGVTYLSHTTSVGVFTPATGLWAIGDLAVGATPILQVTVRVDAQGPIVNTVEIAAEGIDPVGVNNEAGATVVGIDGIVPATGRDSFRTLPLGLGFVIIGLGMLAVGRQRRQDEPGQTV